MQPFKGKIVLNAALRAKSAFRYKRLRIVYFPMFYNLLLKEELESEVEKIRLLIGDYPFIKILWTFQEVNLTIASNYFITFNQVGQLRKCTIIDEGLSRDSYI
ncbi:hypothetical protein HELRODRAFT_167633 [Helobdella robusta]|uniref:Uncharacterized protein n=1 Tax=Helobdella robusta TaxID=6412 RepID=T1EZL1_HELRO|nr:hypothetical protein HELRODRAFT_167633 [Helobdella robusta]ESO11098.1 hypothetical protein HELRODRAFT_167633 [Helobdella robusta]